VALRDMMLEWADQKEQERDRFGRHDDNNSKRNGDLLSNKNKGNFCLASSAPSGMSRVASYAYTRGLTDWHRYIQITRWLPIVKEFVVALRIQMTLPKVKP